jgi:hypothetical protein
MQASSKPGDQGMMTFDAAVAEYLHRTDHARPWTRRQEEDALDGLSGWLRAASHGVPLEAVTPQVIAAYALERGLSAEELDDLRGTVAGLRSWARTVEVVE